MQKKNDREFQFVTDTTMQIKVHAAQKNGWNVAKYFAVFDYWCLLFMHKALFWFVAFLILEANVSVALGRAVVFAFL